MVPTQTETNPLLEIRFRIPFDQITAAHVEPAIAALLVRSRANIDAIAASTAPRTFENTMRALDESSEELDYAMSVIRHLETVATTPELRTALDKVQPPVSAFYTSIALNEPLWKAIQAYAGTPEAAALAGTRKRYLQKTIDSFRRHGADLDPDGKAKLAEIDVELTQVTTKFGQNVLDATREFELVLTAENQLAGLPPSAREAAREAAAARNLEGWRFTLQAPSYIAVMTYLDDREIRRMVWQANTTRATRDPFDNRPLIDRILELRRAKATLLGFADFADFVLYDRMAHTGAQAQKFLDEIAAKTEAHFESENRELEQFAGLEKLEPWDIAYYAEKLRAARFAFDEEDLRPYFPLESVLKGLFDLVGRLYGMRFEEEHGVPAWDPAVKVYAMYDEDGIWIASFYADWYPRDNKRGGAWMDNFLTAVPGYPRPERHAAFVGGNLTAPVGGKPALLSHRDAETIFHEFGHLLHHCFTRVEVRGLAGANTAWDFVELPSQIMENWCWEREALDLFARHWLSGQPIPDDLYQKMRAARTFRAANNQMRQLSFGSVDLALHREYSPQRDGDVMAYCRRLMQRFNPAPLPEDFAMIAAFNHLFAAPVGYGAGYYSYKWAEVLEADAFSRFREHGVFSREIGMEFRTKVLARGDSEDPAVIYRDFMGRDPDPNALLDRQGLLATWYLRPSRRPA
jgi:oligopeptidase A